jgi:hypothetical protein
MNFFKKYICLLSLILIITEITINLTVNFSPTLNPSSSKNFFLEKLSQYFHTAQINPLQLSINDSQNEVEFYLQNPDQNTYQVIFSEEKDPLKQVTALQKLIKIANIKGSDIKFIDLSSKRPYATF